MQTTSRGAEPAPLPDRDRRALAFAAEQRFVLAAQLARLTATANSTATARLRALREAGYLRDGERLPYEPAPFQITRRGLEAVGAEIGPPRRIDPRLYRHEVGVGWLTVGAHLGAFGPLREVIGERRMRSEDLRRLTADQRPVRGVRPLGGDPRRLHYPDLTVVTADGHRIAFELELTTKAPRSRERVLRAYAADPHFDAVVYLVRTDAARRALEASAARVGAADRLQVRRFEWGGRRPPGAAPPAAVRHRDARARTPQASR